MIYFASRRLTSTMLPRCVSWTADRLYLVYELKLQNKHQNPYPTAQRAHPSCMASGEKQDGFSSDCLSLNYDVHAQPAGLLAQ